MNYAKLAFRLRPRSAYEAADLGVKLARHWWLSLTLLWLATALPCFFVLFLLIDNINIAILVFWWLKPLYERALLYFMSRAVFSEPPSLKETLKQTPRLMWRQIFQTLTIRRFSPGRAFDTPVVMLEGLKGKARSRRLTVLHRDKAGSVAFWQTIIGVHVEFFIWIGVVATVMSLIPETVQLQWETLIEAEYIQALCAIVSMALVAPFYVAGGFGLYLNRRVILEGWDLELVFKDLVRRHTTLHQQQEKAVPGGQSLMLISWGLMAGLLSFNLLWTSPVYAEQHAGQEQQMEVSNEPGVVTPQSAYDEISEILQSPDFRRIEKRRLPKFLKDWLEAEDDEEERELTDHDPWMLSLGENLGTIFQVLAWLGAIALVLYILYYYRDGIIALAGKRIDLKRRKEPPSHILNMDIRESSLPDEVSAVAARLWQQGKRREAMALLYRASLSRLVYRHHLLVTKGSTEGDCLQRVKAMKKSDLFDYFQQLTKSWQIMAYAHIAPGDEEFNLLCQAWSQTFDLPTATEEATQNET